MASPDAVDPISLEPLSSMPYPAFELRADPTFTTVDNDWFDPLTLSSYLVSTGNFTHPISRRELTRADCQSLDAFLELHKCGGGNKCEYAFDHKDEYKAAADARRDPANRLIQMQREASQVLQSLFAGIRVSGEAQQRARRANEVNVVQSEGNMTMIDEDERRHAPANPGRRQGAGRGSGAPRAPSAQLGRDARLRAQGANSPTHPAKATHARRLLTLLS